MEDREFNDSLHGFRVFARTKISFQLLIRLLLHLLKCGQMLLDLIAGQVPAVNQCRTDFHPF